MATFFQANGYFQIKSNEAFTVPDSPDFKNLEKLETEGYERAKNIRQEVLKEVSGFMVPHVLSSL
jgi:E3 ubiquitin-protein ligase SHPRH